MMGISLGGNRAGYGGKDRDGEREIQDARAKMTRTARLPPAPDQG